MTARRRDLTVEHTGTGVRIIDRRAGRHLVLELDRHEWHTVAGAADLLIATTPPTTREAA